MDKEQQQERRQAQQSYDGDDRRKMEHNYEKPMGDEESRKPAMNDDGDQPN
jgi:hypothetical protein